MALTGAKHAGRSVLAMTVIEAPVAQRLTWRQTEVDGRPVAYGEAGEGRPVLFLHGWALGHHAYKRALGRLAGHGCRVIAPALPGFGGTVGLPSVERSMTGYAEWVDRFLDAIGVDEPAVVVGHSFGGGVATLLAHDHPARVDHLVLVNAVGGGVSAEDRHLADRRLWEWAVEFTRDLLPLVGPQGRRALASMREDVLFNVLRDPVGLLEIGRLAGRADLRVELEELRRRKLPVLVVAGADDRVIPTQSFDAICLALGTEGTLVPGRHCWLLADPSAFTEVMSNVVGMKPAPSKRTGGRRSPMAAAKELRRLLDRTSMPPELIGTLIGSAPSLWLTSDGPAALAGDLALCHPALGPAEVRARASTATADGSWRLTVVARDRPGLLADTAAVLAAEGLSVEGAAVATWGEPDIALHALRVTGPLPDEQVLARVGDRLRTMGPAERPTVPFSPVGEARVWVAGDADGDPVITVEAPDQVGLLWAICRWLADHDLSIQAAWVTSDTQARDVFVVRGAVDTTALQRRLSRQEQRPPWAGAVDWVVRAVLPVR